jgi:alcohol dehydrogenase class IV
MNFEFATAARIIFGPGKFLEVGPLAAELGKSALIVSGSTGEHAAVLEDQLKRAGTRALVLPVNGEPSTASVMSGAAAARGRACDVVIGLGGGSALDTAKAIAALLSNGGDLLEYLEVVGKGQPLAKASVPCIAIPTTAGTGSEVTRNAVLESPEHCVKVSLRSPFLLPRLAVVDPQLTFSMPPALTASTGLDALTQVVEPYVCNAPNPMVDPLCREGIRVAALALRRAFHDGQDPTARERMSLVSLFGGLALANAKLGAVHGLAAPIGGRTGAPHGAVCARLLPFAMEANIRALEQRQPDSPALGRYREIAALVTGRTGATLAEAVQWFYLLCEELQVHPLSKFGLSESDCDPIVTQAQKASSMKGNPIALTDDEVLWILKKGTVPI